MSVWVAGTLSCPCKECQKREHEKRWNWWMRSSTREEMGKALCGIWEAVLEHDGALDREERWSRIAERFAAWLREQEKGQMAQKKCKVCGLEGHRCVPPEATRDTDEIGDVIPGLAHPSLVCPKGHVLTHPEDIARRFCGTCREFLS